MSEHAHGPWLTIIGIGDNGLESLTPEAQAVVWQAETLVIGERLDAVIDGASLPGLKRILTWGAGFRETLAQILKLRGTPVTVLATGDPMHFGIGARPPSLWLLPGSAGRCSRSRRSPCMAARSPSSIATSCRAPGFWR